MIEFFAYILIGSVVLFVLATGALALTAVASVPLIIMTSITNTDDDN